MFWTYFQWAVLWLSYLVFPWIVFNVWMVSRKRRNVVWRIVWGGLLILSLLFVYMRFAEPQMIVVREEEFGGGPGTVPVRVAVISDLHLGVFKDSDYLQRILKSVETRRADLIVIPGDFINDPSQEQLSKMFEPFKAVKVPLVGVTGNHDAKVPGHFSSEEVRQALDGMVTMVDNGAYEYQKGGRKLRILGVSDLMEGRSDYGVLSKATAEDFDLLITHNPDTAYEIPAKYSYSNREIDLMFSGHTHGGQMFIPPLVYWMIPCDHPFVRGWYEVRGLPVYVTSGLGEVLLPMRFLVPPEVVIMDLKI